MNYLIAWSPGSPVTRSCLVLRLAARGRDARMIRRGEGGGRGAVWAFMAARGVGCDRVSPTWKREELDAGGHKGPPIPASAALAPTSLWGRRRRWIWFR